jgi:uncharacterized phage protein (TIGR02220 family)/predicted phage replisome organizer
MADKEKKYYWLKLPRNFFTKHYILILLAKDNGKELVLFYIRLLTESIDHEGKLRYSEKTPYTTETLSEVTGFPLQFVTQALQIFSDMELVVTESDGTLFLPKSLKMIGSESGSAQRVREYRNRKKEEQEQGKTAENVGISDNSYIVEQSNSKKQKCNTEKEIEKEIDKDIKKDNVGKTPTPDAYKTIIEYLNEKTNSHYRHTTKSTQRIINGRLSEHFTVDDFKLVIDIKSSQWMGDKKMSAYLRPETLFAASHFESYLNEARQTETKKPKYFGLSEKMAAETAAQIGRENDYGDFK